MAVKAGVAVTSAFAVPAYGPIADTFNVKLNDAPATKFTPSVDHVPTQLLPVRCSRNQIGAFVTLIAVSANTVTLLPFMPAANSQTVVPSLRTSNLRKSFTSC